MWYKIIDMISINSLKQMASKLHLEDLSKSMNECRKDNKGGFLIPTSAKLTDTDYEHYRHLPINWSIPPVTKEDLPIEFSPQAIKTVDMFRRKTVDLPYECMIYFDYKSGNIVSCNFSDKNSPDEVNGFIYSYLLKKMNIASIHNHPPQYGSPPSGKNFEMLGLEFEEFELISSRDELWILESHDVIYSDEEINEIRNKVDSYYDLVSYEVNSELVEGYVVIDNINKKYGDFLLNYLNNYLDNIKLTRRYLNG